MDFGIYPTGWHIEGDLPNQVAVSTGSTVATFPLSSSYDFGVLPWPTKSRSARPYCHLLKKKKLCGVMT